MKTLLPTIFVMMLMASFCYGQSFKTETYANGNVYVGEFTRGIRNGQGTYTWNDGPSKSDWYIGESLDDERTGYGRYIFGPENTRWAGHVYEGNIR